MPTREDVVQRLQTVFDPELNLDVWNLGLIYDIQVREDSTIYIRMTFTTPFCPYGPALVDDLKKKVSTLPGTKDVQVEVVMEPPWQPSEEIKLMFGLGGYGVTGRK